MGILAPKLGDDVVQVLLRAESFRSSTSTMAAISHMLEMVGSSMDMVSRLGRSSLMGMLPIIPLSGV